MMTGTSKIADWRLTGASIADVEKGVWLAGWDVLIKGDRIEAVVPALEGEARKTADLTGRFVIPALIDSHVHIESSMLTPARFADLVVPHGTGTVIADPHEIANVLGTAGLDFMLAACDGLALDICWMLPSCVPATPFEHSGAKLEAADLAPYFEKDHVLGLGEVMNVPGVLAGDAALMAKIHLAKRLGRPVDGHAPGADDETLKCCAAAGITSDHECATGEELQRRIACGIDVSLREGSAARDLTRLLAGVTKENASHCFFCTDDAHASDVSRRGHIDKHLRMAVKAGTDAMTAVQMATVNAARHYGLDDIGVIAAGRRADIAVVDNLADFNVTHVWLKGELVARDGRVLKAALPTQAAAAVTGTVKIAPFTVDDLRLPLTTSTARVIAMRAGEIVTDDLQLSVNTRDGAFDAAVNPGLVKLAVIERHHALNCRGLGILSGYARAGHVFSGAVATTIAHDSHNLIIAGGTDEDMVVAARHLQAIGGGICAVKNGLVVGELSLPVAGLMSDEPAESFIKSEEAFYRAVRQNFDIASGIDPVITLAFMALPVIPCLRLTDMGLFDVTTFGFVDVNGQ